jgi:CheY-like chemotaxis protein
MTTKALSGVESYQPHGPIRLRVLCIDDNADVADSEAMLLEMFGCTVAIAYNGQTALQKAHEFTPDICLVDFTMPLMDGCEVARWMKMGNPNRPVYLIAITANCSQEARDLTKAAGFDAHLTKPFDWIELYDVLHKFKLDALRNR